MKQKLYTTKKTDKEWNCQIVLKYGRFSSHMSSLVTSVCPQSVYKKWKQEGWKSHKNFFFFLLVMIKTSFFFTYSHLFPSKKRLNTPGGAFNLSCGITVRKKTWRSSIGMDLTLTAKANIPTNAAFALQVTIWIWADGDNGFDADHRCFK